MSASSCFPGFDILTSGQGHDHIMTCSCPHPPPPLSQSALQLSTRTAKDRKKHNPSLCHAIVLQAAVNKESSTSPAFSAAHHGFINKQNISTRKQECTAQMKLIFLIFHLCAKSGPALQGCSVVY